MADDARDPPTCAAEMSGIAPPWDLFRRILMDEADAAAEYAASAIRSDMKEGRFG